MHAHSSFDDYHANRILFSSSMHGKRARRLFNTFFLPFQHACTKILYVEVFVRTTNLTVRVVCAFFCFYVFYNSKTMPERCRIAFRLWTALKRFPLFEDNTLGLNNPRALLYIHTHVRWRRGINLNIQVISKIYITETVAVVRCRSKKKKSSSCKNYNEGDLKKKFFWKINYYSSSAYVYIYIMGRT